MANLSQHARERLAANIGEVWFQELLENLRYAATFAERSYTAARILSELEHQALNGSFREGAAWQVDRIIGLSKDPAKTKPQLEPFGTLLPTPSDPKSLSTLRK